MTMRNIFHNPNSTFRLHHIITGGLIWCGIVAVAVCFVLDSPRYDSNGMPIANLSIPETLDTSDTVTEYIEFISESRQDDSQDIDNVKDTERSALVSTNKLSVGWYVQVGSYNSEIRAGVEKLKYAKLNVATVTEAVENGSVRLLVGPYSSENEVTQVKRLIRKEIDGSKSVIRRVANSKPEAAPTETEDQENKPLIATTPTDQPNASDKKQTSPEIAAISLPRPKKTSKSGWYVQLGAFKNIKNARLFSDRVRALNYPIRVENTDEQYIRILVGPYPTQNEAETAKVEVVRALDLESSIIRNIDS